MDSLKYESQNVVVSGSGGLVAKFKSPTQAAGASFSDAVSMSRVSAEEMDEMRQQNIAYEYLCHLEEAKK
jgi:hypothetical protein